LAPLAITGSKLRGIIYHTPVASAQIKSALLLASLYAEGATSVIEPQLSRDHTERLFEYLGIPLVREGLSVSVEGRPSIRWGRKEIAVAGDFSAAAFFMVGATIVPGSDVMISGVGINPTRIGLLHVLKKMGADITHMNQREQGGEPVADLRIRSASLRGVTIARDEIPQTIDEFPIFCVAAAVANGRSEISGAEELRVKESDRIATMAGELRAMGAHITEKPDGAIIEGLGRGNRNGSLEGARCTSRGDHRVAMSMAVGALTAEHPTPIDDAECIDTSFPDFHDKLLTLLGK